MKNLFKRTLAVLLTVVMLLTAAPLSDLVGLDWSSMLGFKAEAANVGINIGDYIKLGTYNGEAILWRCVDIDENGPLMLSDKILCLKAYDACGNNTEYHSDGWGWIRNSYGSNCWSDSNLRQWLNSDDIKIEWSHCPPKSEAVLDGYNSYDEESGFLCGFSLGELACVKSVTQRVYINSYETQREGYFDGGSQEIVNVDFTSSPETFKNCYYQNVTDRFFLLGAEQIVNTYKNLGDYIYAYPTENCVNESNYKNDALSSEKPWEYWVNVAGNDGASFEHTRFVWKEKATTLGANAAYMGIYGVRPAFYLDISAAYSNFDTFNVIENKGPVSDCDISFSVYALDKASTEDNPIYIDANGAKVSIYLGADRIASTNVVNGVASFKKSDFPSKYDIKYIKKNATVSAHLKAENGLELCSEEVKGNGRWDGAKLSKVLSGESRLVADEPRWYVPELRVMINESDEENCKNVLREYSRLFAQATNGHVIVNEFEIVTVPNSYRKKAQEKLKEICFEMNIDICMVRHKDEESWATVGYPKYIYLTGQLQSLMSGYEYKDKEYGNAMIWCPINYSGCSNTLCHESGHYLLGFTDEYASGIGAYTALSYLSTHSESEYEKYLSKYDSLYSYDADGNGKINWYEKDNAKWRRGDLGEMFIRVGVTRPAYAPDNFGLMDNQYKSIEMSRSSTYAGADKNNPKDLTAHYYYINASCEEKMIYELGNLAGDRYAIDYSEATQTQTAWYDCAGGDNVTFTPPSIVTNSVLNQIEITTNSESDATLGNVECFEDNCNFNYSNGNVYITSAESTEVTVYGINDTEIYRFDLNSENSYTACFEVEPDLSYTVTVCREVDGVGYYNEYSLDVVQLNSATDISGGSKTINLCADSDGNAIIVSRYNNGESIVEGYASLAYEYNVCTENSAEASGYLEKSVGYNIDIDYSSMTWFYKADNEWIALETMLTIDDHNNPMASCEYVDNGTYCLMAKQPSDSNYAAPADVSVINTDQLYDNDVTVTFTDSNENVMYYNIYYGTEPVTAENCEEMNVYVADSTQATISLDDSKTTYYFAVQVVGNDGGRSELSECVSSTGALLDSDGDGLPDYWIDMYPILAELEDIPGTDSDDDGLTNIKEYQLGTNPLNPDTDGDNVYDGLESFLSLNPLETMTDGETDDYIVVYGAPDVFVDETSFVVDETTVTCAISNNTDGKAMRTEILLYVGEEIVNISMVNIDANSSVEYSFPKEYLVENMRIVIDEGKITRDADYSNNEFVYVPVTSITFSEQNVTLLKNNGEKLAYILTPENATDIIAWSVSDAAVAKVSDDGVITGTRMGTAKVTATALNGVSCTVDILVEPLPGVGLIEYDCDLNYSGTEVEIVYYAGNDETVVIPDSIAGYPVTIIGKSAFAGNTTIKSVTISQNIEYILVECFYGCTALEEVNFIGTVKAIPPGAFQNCTSLKSVDIPEGVINISNYAFNGCTSLESVSLPSTLGYIGYQAFMDCVSLTEITIPENVVRIYAEAFSGCSALTTLNYNAIAAKYYTKSGGVGNVFNNTRVFDLCHLINTINIGEKVEELPCYFAWSESITSINIPRTMKKINSNAFKYSSLETIDYDGTRYMWRNIKINTTYLDDVTVNCISVVSSKNNSVFDEENGLVYGLDIGFDSLYSYADVTVDGYRWEYTPTVNGFGTGSEALLTNGTDVIDGYTIVIFGDIDGNGWYDANDAFLVKMLVSGLLTREVVGEAVYKAADCNHDGVVDGLDVQLLERASVLLDDVNQSATQAELSFDSSYIEYCSLIDQSAGLEAEPAPEENNAEHPAETQPEAEFSFDLLAIFRFIFSIFEKMFTVIISLIG